MTTTRATPVIGWDIGGVNLKVARVRGGEVCRVIGEPFELQHAPAELTSRLRDLATRIGAEDDDAHAVTMTAELSQLFRTKRDGVTFVVDAIEAAFPGSAIHVYGTDGAFLTPEQARAQPLRVAAANWSATAHLVARHAADALLVDIGTTTTDLIPIVNHRVVAEGMTDPDRLASGELIYTGAVRTPVEAVVNELPWGGVSAEAFALIGDVHVWRGDLADADYSVPTPDGRPSSRPFAGERLARVVCGDREMLSDTDIDAIAEVVATAQVERIAATIETIVARHTSITRAVVAGLGSFIGDAAARLAGLDAYRLADVLGPAAARCAPAAAVALLLDETPDHPTSPAPPVTRDGVELVVKIGGSLLRHPDALTLALDLVASAARDTKLVVVGGGGPFADVVRAIDTSHSLTPETAHRMAILAMDQYAELLASRCDRATVARSATDIAAAHRAGTLPIVAPSAWLRLADPLPHSWDVTSDSIAAWLARQLGAERLVLIKAPGASGTDAVDAYFPRAVTPGLRWTVVPAETAALRQALHTVTYDTPRHRGTED